jgi:hypothetical protein
MLVGVVSSSMAAEITLECPTEHPGQPKLSLRYGAEALSVTDADGTTALPGTVKDLPSGMFGISAHGPMTALMPEPAALDKCLVDKLKQLGMRADDADALTYVANACRLKLSSSATMQKIEADFVITALEPGEAMLYIERQYAAPSAVTGKPVTLAEFPTRNCKVLTGP